MDIEKRRGDPSADTDASPLHLTALITQNHCSWGIIFYALSIVNLAHSL